MPVVAFDLRHPEIVAHELAEANQRLAREEDVPPSIVELIRDLGEQIADTSGSELEAIDPYLWIEVQQGALKALNAVAEDDPASERRQIRISLEHLRFLLTRLSERQSVSEDRPITEVVRWLDQVLSVPQRRKADLLGVAERTFQRWIATNPTMPDADDEQAIRLLARITNQLRHSLGGTGVLDWLEHERDDLEGARPIDLLRDVSATDQLLILAAATRASTAA